MVTIILYKMKDDEKCDEPINNCKKNKLIRSKYGKL